MKFGRRIAGAALLGWLAALGSTALAQERSEDHERIAQGMEGLALRGSWAAVERDYKRLIALGQPLSPREHLLGAHAARVRGDAAGVESRLNAGAAAGGLPEIVAWQQRFANDYCELRVNILKGARSLQSASPADGPDGAAAVEAAAKDLSQGGRWRGKLPCGDYTVAGRPVELRSGTVTTVRIQGGDEVIERKTLDALATYRPPAPEDPTPPPAEDPPAPQPPLANDLDTQRQRISDGMVALAEQGVWAAVARDHRRLQGFDQALTAAERALGEEAARQLAPVAPPVPPPAPAVASAPPAVASVPRAAPATEWGGQPADKPLAQSAPPSKTEAPPAALVAPLNAVGAARVQSGTTRHPCAKAEDLGPGRYARKSVVLFPVHIDEGAVEASVSYRGSSLGGVALANDSALLASVATGLTTVDLPLERLDLWLSPTPPTDARSAPSSSLPAVSEALACADWAMQPRLTRYIAERKSKKSKNGKTSVYYVVSLDMVLDLYQRQGSRMVLVASPRARAPGPVDLVEDAMSAARSATVDQLANRIPGGAGRVDEARELIDGLLLRLPEAQRPPLQDILQQTELAVTRVASIARPMTLAPVLDGGAGPHPAADGLGWRAVENQCYLNPPDSDEADWERRAVECAVLNRVRQATRQVQLETRKQPAFRLYAPATVSARQAKLPLGKAEGLRVGDGYWLMEGSQKVGYARVRSLGPGGALGGQDASGLQVVYGQADQATTRVDGREDPRLGIEIGPWVGRVPAKRPAASLPDDPVSGGARDISEGGGITSGELRFDVNLGRMTGWYEWYQTNRLAFGATPGLRRLHASFGVEKRFLLMPRTWALAGAALSLHRWRIPSGELRIDDDGDPYELGATAARVGPEFTTGIAVMASPSVVVRGTFGVRTGKAIDSFTWRHDDEEGEVVPLSADGAFRLQTTGLSAGLSTSWVF